MPSVSTIDFSINSQEGAFKEVKESPQALVVRAQHRRMCGLEVMDKP